MRSTEEELLELIEKLVGGALSDHEARRLDKILYVDPDLRRVYLEYLHQHACFHLHSNGASARKFGDQPPAGGWKPYMPAFYPWCWICLTILGLGVLILEGLRLQKTESTPIATLAETKDCSWRGGTLPTVKGSLLTEGTLELASGIATILFRSGAKVVLEAPSEIELIDPMKCFLRKGTLIATVPPNARGFVVETETARLTDFGTEFAVNFNRKKATTKVEVFKGTVDLEHLSSKKHQILSAGQSSTIDKQGFEVLERMTYYSGPSSPVVEGFGPNWVKITTAEGKGKDGHICNSKPDMHRGNQYLLVKNSYRKSQLNRKAYLAFDLSPLEKKEVKRARLQLQILRSGIGYSNWVPDATFAVYGVTDQTLDDWDEDTLTWNNAPANKLTGNSIDPAKVTFVGRFNIPQSKWWGLASIEGRLLTDFLNSDTNGLATLVIIRETEELHFGGLIHSFSGSGNPGGIAPTLLLELEK